MCFACTQHAQHSASYGFLHYCNARDGVLCRAGESTNFLGHIWMFSIKTAFRIWDDRGRENTYMGTGPYGERVDESEEHYLTGRGQDRV